VAVDKREVEQWVEAAKRAGAAAAEILVAEWSGHEIRVERGRAVARSTPSGSGVRVRVYDGEGRTAAAAGAIASVSDVVRDAVAGLAASAPDPFGGPARDSDPVDPRELGVDDRRYDKLTDADRLDVLLGAERAARAEDSRALTDVFTWSDRRERRLFVCSHGPSREEFGTTYAASGSVRLGNDDQMVALTDRAEARSYATLSSIPFGAAMVSRAADALRNPARIEGPIRVMLTPRAVAPLVAGLADAMSEGRSFLDVRGASIDRRFHLLDDGALPGGLATHAFDDRGVAPLPVVLIREGRRDQRYQGPSEARSAGARPTGHERDGMLRPSNLVLRGGTRTMNAIVSERSDVDTLFVHDVVGAESIDWSTGDVALVAYGVLRRGNQVKGGAPGVTLRGRLGDVFSRLVDLASDTDRHGRVDASGLLVDGFVAAP
jgi:PmbA protein